jgi:hypothetical protein
MQPNDNKTTFVYHKADIERQRSLNSQLILVDAVLMYSGLIKNPFYYFFFYNKCRSCKAALITIYGFQIFFLEVIGNYCDKENLRIPKIFNH